MTKGKKNTKNNTHTRGNEQRAHIFPVLFWAFLKIIPRNSTHVHYLFPGFQKSEISHLRLVKCLWIILISKAFSILSFKDMHWSTHTLQSTLLLQSPVPLPCLCHAHLNHSSCLCILPSRLPQPDSLMVTTLPEIHWLQSCKQDTGNKMSRWIHMLVWIPTENRFMLLHCLSPSAWGFLKWPMLESEKGADVSEIQPYRLHLCRMYIVLKRIWTITFI